MFQTENSRAMLKATFYKRTQNLPGSDLYCTGVLQCLVILYHNNVLIY